MRYRRAQGLVTFWQDNRVVYFNCRTETRRTISADVLEVLHRLDSWSTAAEFRAQYPDMGTTREVADLFDALADMDLLDREDAKAAKWAWADWMPEAAFFHFGTRSAEYPMEIFDHEARLREKAKTHPQPAPTKSLAGPRVGLSKPTDFGDLSHALLDRRTWRSFSADPVSVDQLANLLGLTWGVQRKGRVEGQGNIVFKTSPSGGARHPGEVYVIAQNVAGLDPAVYHYDALAHELVRVGNAVPRDELVAVLANQYYFGNSSAVFVLTACFERSMWRYPFTRSYRSVLIEAGHLGQTFALLATAMQLAPFQTIAYEDSKLEALLGLRSETESAMYVVGVGNRNPDAAGMPGRILPKEMYG